MSTTNFASRTVLVTGASRGLGLAIAKAFWGRGADLFLVAHPSEPLAAVAEDLRKQAVEGQRVAWIAVDLAEPGAVPRIFDTLRAFTSRLDVVVNNAAMLGPIGPLTENDWSAWRTTFQVDMLAPAEICREAIPWMRERGGVLLNLSGGGATSPRPFFTAYGAAKAALVRFSETLAVELAQYRIRVNCIAPGAMNTEMNSAVLKAGAELAGDAEYRKAVDQSGGAMPPELPAEMAVRLASDECAGITGRIISAAWDPWRELEKYAAEIQGSDIYTLRRIVPEDRGRQWPR